MFDGDASAKEDRMSRPATELEYLSRQVPSSVSALGPRRRSLLRAGLGAGLVGGLAACGEQPRILREGAVVENHTPGAGASSAPAALAGGEVRLGSNASDQVPKKTVAALAAGYTSQSGTTIKINTVEHNAFQENINTYLQGRPDDVFTWFAGYRMKFFAAQGLAGDLTDVWKSLDGYTDGFRKACTGDDAKQYLVPVSYYPWAVFYRPSLWKAKGYAVPKTLDDLKTLCRK